MKGDQVELSRGNLGDCESLAGGAAKGRLTMVDKSRTAGEQHQSAHGQDPCEKLVCRPNHRLELGVIRHEIVNQSTFDRAILVLSLLFTRTRDEN